MRVWLLCFGLLFAGAELILWLKEIILPLPIYILAGAFLAIASNYRSSVILPTSTPNQPDSTSKLSQAQTNTSIEPSTQD